MTTKASTIKEYVQSLPDDRKEAIEQLRQIFLKHLPKGFEETMNYGMIGYVVPHNLYPKGYHCAPKQPLPFINIASQKNFIALYHMGIYANAELLSWFTAEYSKHTTARLDMGKSCIRFKKPEHIPFELLTQLAQKMSPKDWIALYEKAFKK